MQIMLSFAQMCRERAETPRITEQFTGCFAATLCVSVLSVYAEQKQRAT